MPSVTETSTASLGKQGEKPFFSAFRRTKRAVSVPSKVLYLGILLSAFRLSVGSTNRSHQIEAGLPKAPAKGKPLGRPKRQHRSESNCDASACGPLWRVDRHRNRLDEGTVQGPSPAKTSVLGCSKASSVVFEQALENSLELALKENSGTLRISIEPGPLVCRLKRFLPNGLWWCEVWAGEEDALRAEAGRLRCVPMCGV